MIIGVGVEEPSAKKFWDKVLHKHFPGVRFEIMNYKTKGDLIKKTPSLLELCRDAHYDGCFILIDSHEQPCVRDVRELFDEAVQQEIRKSKSERYLFLCVVIKGLECWFLADGDAINELIPECNYSPPDDTSTLNPKSQLKKLDYKSSKKISLSENIAPKFNPNRAKKHSFSFAYFWDCLQTKFRLIES